VLARGLFFRAFLQKKRSFQLTNRILSNVFSEIEKQVVRVWHVRRPTNTSCSYHIKVLLSHCLKLNDRGQAVSEIDPQHNRLNFLSRKYSQRRRSPYNANAGMLNVCVAGGGTLLLRLTMQHGIVRNSQAL